MVLLILLSGQIELFNPRFLFKSPISICIVIPFLSIQGQIGSTISYLLTVPIPSDGRWIGAFIQAAFPGREGSTLTLTTETLILPNTYPVEECIDQECYGQLV